MQGNAFEDDKKSQPAWLHSGRLGKNKDYDEQQKNDLMLGLALEPCLVQLLGAYWVVMAFLMLLGN